MKHTEAFIPIHVRALFQRLIRVCGKWTLIIAVFGAWNAVFGTLRGIEWWQSEAHVQQRFATIWPDVADSYRRERRKQFASAAVGAVASAVSVAVARKRWVRAQRSASNQCLNCNYNLTGNTSGVCPECGTAISQASRPP